MSRHRNLRYFALIGLVFLLAGLLWAQRGPDKKLEVNGKTMDSPIVQIGGRSYVDLETLAQITNGVIAVQPDRVVLTIPTAPSAAPPSPRPDALSREFAREAIGLLAEMREWRGGSRNTRSYKMEFTRERAHDYCQPRPTGCPT